MQFACNVNTRRFGGYHMYTPGCRCEIPGNNQAARKQLTPDMVGNAW